MARLPDRDAADPTFAGALEAVRSDDLELARARFAALVEASPRSAVAWTNYGAVLGELGRVEEARRALRTALALDPASVEATSNLGVLDREDGRLDAAEGAFLRLIERDGDNLAARYNLAHTLFLDGRFEEAAEAYRDGLRRDPAKTPNQNARLAWALVAAGRGAEARRELRRTLERIAPDEVDALHAEAAEVLPAIAAARPQVKSETERLARALVEATRSR